LRHPTYNGQFLFGQQAVIAFGIPDNFVINPISLACVEIRTNIGHKSNFTIIEGYGKVRISAFEIRIGRSKEIMGLCDTSLTSGAWAVSGNAPGIPKVQLSIPEFYSLPLFGKLFAFKGNFAHGCM